MAYFHLARQALKWAVSKPVTTRYPFEPRQPIAGSRGRLAFDASNCTYCTVCARKCPTRAIVVKRATQRWTLDRLLCISCAYCVESCPKHCLSLTTEHGVPSRTKDREFYGVGMAQQNVEKPTR